MQTQAIVGIGGFPNEAMVEYVLTLAHDLILGGGGGRPLGARLLR